MRYIIISMFFIFISCDNLHNNKEVKSETNVKKSYYPNKVLKSEIYYNDSAEIELAKNYYKTGELAKEISYKNGMKNGIAKKYYENGTVFRESPYMNDKKTGIEKKYYESGKLMAEIPYKNGMPGKGLKEYEENNTMITKYPKIVIEHKNTINLNNRYTIKIYLSNKSSKATFYNTTLIDGEYFNKKSNPIPSKNGIAELSINVGYGRKLPPELSIVSYTTTRLRNPLVLAKKIKLSQ
jgi:MORN repeat variant